MPITREELQESITRLRARRESIPALRDYRPQSRSKKASKTSSPKQEVDLLDVFGGLIKTEADSPAEVPTSADQIEPLASGEAKGEGGES